MSTKRFALATLLFSATAVSADTLGDIRAALHNLPGNRPVSATYETKSGNVAKGRFFDQDVTSSASVEARVDGEGVTLVYPRSLLDRFSAEREALDAGRKLDPKVQQVSEVSAPRIAEMLDFASSLDAMLQRATIVDERPGAVDGKPARLVSMTLASRDQPGLKGGHFDVKSDRLTLWIGADSVPLVGERTAKFSAGILFLKMSGDILEKWTFARRDDRLVVMRYERTDNSGGMGQTSKNNEVETITIRSAS